MQTLNPKFYQVFSQEELDTISQNATALSHDVIVIATDEYFFELSADVGEELEIYCDNYSDNTARTLNKEEFLKLYQSSPLLDVVDVEMEE